MASKRIYITLNTDKEKDRVIIDYLESCYSEKDAIKEAIYRVATKEGLSVQIGANCIERVQKGASMICDDNLINIPERCKNIEKDKNSTEKVQNDKSKEDNILLDLNNFDESYAEVKKDTELEKNQLEQLQKFI